MKIREDRLDEKSTINYFMYSNFAGGNSNSNNYWGYNAN